MSATGSASVSVCVCMCECECELVQKPNVLSIQRFANNFAVHFQGNDCLPPKKVPNKNWDFLEFNQYYVARHLSSSICFSPFFFTNVHVFLRKKTPKPFTLHLEWATQEKSCAEFAKYNITTYLGQCTLYAHSYTDEHTQQRS